MGIIVGSRGKGGKSENRKILDKIMGNYNPKPKPQPKPAPKPRPKK